MDKKSKLISGLSDRKIIRKPNKYFTDSEKQEIIQEYISTGCSKKAIWQKYTGQEQEHGQFIRWMRQFGYDDEIICRTSTFAKNKFVMAKKETSKNMINPSDDSFENLQLKKRISELEKQLKDAELKAIAFSTMVDIAEKEFKIPIRKKYNTKP